MVQTPEVPPLNYFEQGRQTYSAPLFEFIPEELSRLGDPAAEALTEVLPDFCENFNDFWAEQEKRCGANGETLDQSDWQRAFEKDVRLFYHVVGTVLEIDRAEPYNEIFVFWDADDTIGAVPESEHKQLFEIDSPTEEQIKDYKRIREATDYDAFIIRPIVPIIVNYLHTHFGDRVVNGLLSTKGQDGLENHLLPRLQKLCPDAFAQELVIGLRDGRFDFSEHIQALTADRHARLPLRALISYEPTDSSFDAEKVIDFDQTKLTDSSSQEDLKIPALLRLVAELGEHVTIVSVDNWPTMLVFKNTGSRIRAVPINKLGAQFTAPGAYDWGDLAPSL